MPPALRLLRRANDGLKIAMQLLDMLEHMSPWEYQTIRKILGHGSGFDSPGFRNIRRVSPSLGEAFNALRTSRISRSSTSTCTAATTRSCTSSPRR